MDWADVAQKQAGVISRAQLRGCGCADAMVGRLVRRGALIRHEMAVFVVRGAPVTYRAQLWIAVLSTGGVLGFATAAHLWRMVEHPPPNVDSVVGARRKVKLRYGLRVHRVFVPASAVTTLAGLPVTTRAWTLVDHLGRLPFSEALRLTDRALQREWINRSDLAGRTSDYPGRQGNQVIRALVAATGDGAAATSERTLHGLLKRARIGGWIANYELSLDGAVVAIVDIAFPEHRLAVEVDGMAYHVDVDRFQRDRRRQNTLVTLGWTVLRFTWADLTQRPQYVIATIRGHVG